MILRLHITNKEIDDYLTDRGYKISTIRKILINEYGYKNTKEILEKLSPVVTEDFLKLKLSFLNDKEYMDMCGCLSELIKFIKQYIEDSGSRKYLPRGFYLLYYNPNDSDYIFSGDSTNSLVKYQVKTVYCKLILKEPCFSKNRINRYGSRKSLYYLS